MTSVMSLVILGAALIAVGGGMFGVGAARILWAQDLHHVLKLKVSWEKSRTAMENTIDSQDRTIDALKRTIDTQKRTIAIIDGRTR